MKISIKALDDWNKRLDVPLSNAMAASIEIVGGTGRKACEKALVYMAMSAARARNNLTQAAKKNRPTLEDKHGKYVERYRYDGKIAKDYKWSVERAGNRTWDQAREIVNRGLARRSWMWGIADFHKQAKGKPIYGVADVAEIVAKNECGLILTNRLGYIQSAIVPNLEQQVATMASNSIMAQSAREIEKLFGLEIPRAAASRAKKAQARLDQAFRRARGRGRAA